jgi:hypothetical protein
MVIFMDILACKRCLVYEMAEASQYQTMYDYIKNLDEGVKTSEEVYQERLKTCKQCDNLLAGMCRICGCYVELRAAIQTKSCPAPAARW